MSAYVVPKSGGLAAPAAKLPTSSALSSTADVWTAAGVGTPATATPGNGVLTFVPFDVAAALTISGVAVEVVAAATGGSPVVRVGVYASDGQGWPGNLLGELGTLDAASAGVKATTASLALAPGRYWLAAACQGATVTQPTVRTTTGSGVSIPAESAAAAMLAPAGLRISGALTTGALPATATSTGLWQAVAPIRVAVRTGV